MTAPIVRCEHCGHRNRVPPAATGVPHCGHCHAPLPWMADAGDDTFADIADASSIPVLVDLWAPWCGPCRMVSPVLEKLARDYAGRVKLVKVNVDEAPRLARRFEAQSIPTLVVLQKGTVVATQIGAAPESTLRAWLDQSLSPTSDRL